MISHCFLGLFRLFSPKVLVAMSEHSKNISERAVRAINEAADRACANIREDAQKAIGDMEARAEALYQIEIEENGRFIGKGDHLFATEIDLKSYGHDLQIGGANLEVNGYRFQIGSGPMTGNSGPELKQGKRYRMIVAFQELKE